MKKYIITLSTLFTLLSCGDAGDSSSDARIEMQTIQGQFGLVYTCVNYSTPEECITLLQGLDGRNGNDGANGQDGVQGPQGPAAPTPAPPANCGHGHSHCKPKKK